jgi:hypothetical protein
VSGRRVCTKFSAIPFLIVALGPDLLRLVACRLHTAGKWLRPRLEEYYATGQMPALLPGTGDA